jgi:putative hydrolase of the HAD superfamily
VAVDAVIFDWGGTLTPWHTIDHAELWRSICGPHFPADLDDTATALHTATTDLWRAAETQLRSSTLDDVFQRAGIEPTEGLLASYFQAWEPHTLTDPEVAGLLGYLRDANIRTGVLSNTMWPRSWHEDVFRRDDVLHLFDGAVYTSEIDWTKPHPEAFRAAMAAIGVTDPSTCVFVGDRPWDDIHGAKSLGMRAVLLPNDDVPSFDEITPDAVISRLSQLPPLIESW